MVSLKAAFVRYGVLLASCHSFVTSLSLPINDTTGLSEHTTGFSELDGRDVDIDFYLRIMPLGASITKGEPTAPGTNGNGYRKPLRDQLRSEGYKVNMVGSQRLGSMNDKDNEGYPGYRIAQIMEASKEALITYRPNLILINAGTNDATGDDDIPNAGARMEALIWQCFTVVPETTVILSTLIPNGLEGATPRIDEINKQYRALVVKLQKQGLQIALADMNDGFIELGSDEVEKDIWNRDKTHPTVEGFRKMAAVWREAFKVVEENKWMKPPRDDVKYPDDDIGGGTTCDKDYGSGQDDPRSGIQVLTAGSKRIVDDGKYVHKGVSQGKMDFTGSTLPVPIWLAQLYNAGAPRGGELDDLVYAIESQLYVRNNLGDGNFAGSAKIDIDNDCDVGDMRWGDVNNDGLADHICIGSEGDMAVSINKGGNPPTFKHVGKYKNAVKGYSQNKVRLGDIDGDGRLDYCVIGGNGDIRCWRNGGVGDKAEYWQDMGVIFTGKGMGNIDGVRFADINGDGRDDWLWVGEKGDITTWINQRGSSKSMKPYWKEAGKTHTGMGEDVGGRDRILTARVYGSGRADYIYHNADHNLIAWKNEGHGGMHQKGDGAFWGDMTGRGLDDYVWIDHEGNVVIFLNPNNPDALRENPSDYKMGWNDMGVVLETGRDRKSLHVGDWDGDGKADIISAARADGALTVWLTRYNDGAFSFEKKDLGGWKCDQGWGVGLFDIGARFADITGNGRVDYLCMEPNGRTTACLNEGGSPRCVDQVKYSVALDRANFRFADVNGDGKADLLWVDKFNGNAEVWYNKGEVPGDGRVSGSKFEWDRRGKVYLGASRGPNMHFPNLGGMGRADMVYVEPTSGHGWAWFNTCPSGGDDVDGDVPDPQLPPYKPGEVPSPEPDHSGDEFCQAEQGEWNPEMWNNMGMDDWLMRRSRYYDQAGWPSPSNNREGGVPRVIAEFNLNEADNLYNWPGTCRSMDKTCTVKDLGKKECADHWQRAFALFSMQNLANWLGNFAAAFDDLTESIDKQIAQMTKTFIPDQNAELEMSASSWMTMAVGILGTLGPWVGAVSGAAVGSASGVLVMGSVLANKAKTFHDPSFTKFAELESNYGKLTDMAKDAASEYFDRLFTKNPPHLDEPLSTELANILQHGTFADQDLGTGETKVDQALQRKVIKAPIISEIWNSQQLFIHKFKKGSFYFEWDSATGVKPWLFDPCSDEYDAGGELKSRVVCDGDYNYVMVGWGDYRWHMYNNFGAHDEGLESFGFKLKDVVMSANRVQEAAKEFIPRNPAVQEDIFQNMAEKAGKSTDADAIAFNIPVCDTTDIKLPNVSTGSGSRDPCFSNPGWDRAWRQCYATVVMKACRRYELNGHKWPYE